MCPWLIIRQHFIAVNQDPDSLSSKRCDTERAMPLVECVPNVSEGRQPPVIELLVAAVRRVPGAHLLDVSSDAVHNRSVLTLVGDGTAMQQAVLALVEVAEPAIDLRRHVGVHPRMGAVDVVPFVPLTDASMDDCVALARDTARALSARHSLPTYLYAEAATAPHRLRLDQLRRGGLTRLASRMTTRDWAPDFGPAAPHPTAGVTAVGARPVLIAYNVELSTDRIETATAIARTVRERDGGLPGVKALGLGLPDRGIVQVSMTLTNWRHTSIRQAFSAVAEAATRLGAEATASEIVGLVPAAALPPTDAGAIRLRQTDRSPILEDRLRTAGVLATDLETEAIPGSTSP